MDQIIKRKQIVDLLSEKTGFYKHNMDDVYLALGDIILEVLQSATVEQDSEIHLMPGLIISGRRMPAREVKDPRTGKTVLSPEKVIPRATFKPSLRLKLYSQCKSYRQKTKKK